MKISLPEPAIEEFCQKNHIRRLSFFGSVLRDDFGPDSDIDVLVEFEREHVPGLLGMARMERELSEIMNYPVDLRTPGDLSRYFRNNVIKEAQVHYGS